MKKILSLLLTGIISVTIFGASFMIFNFSLANQVDAASQQLGSLLPQTTYSSIDKIEGQCKEGDESIICACLIEKIDTGSEDPAVLFKGFTATKQQNILGCAIMTGRIKFWMIQYFIVYIIEFVVGLSGLIAILFIVIGGYKYILAGATEKKDEAKNTIKNAIIGLVMVLVAWIVVNVVQYLVTI